mgnify:CR=1 FL=1
MKLSLKSLLLSSIFITSCAYEEDIDPIVDLGSNIQTYGIRHDKSLSEYEAVGANNTPYNTSDYPNFSSVVNFTYSLDGSADAEFVASGVLVAPNWILTAGHNFFLAEDQSSPALPAGVSINIGNDPENPEQILVAEQLVFHPTWIDDNEVIAKGNDFCLVRLASQPTGISPALLNRSLDEPLGSTVWHCGFGDYSQQANQDRNAYSMKHAMANILDRKISGVSSTNKNGQVYQGGLVAFDFDSPDGTINSLGDDFISSDEPLLGTGTSDAAALELEGGTVEGDSGGPLWAKINNQWQVIGILSGGADAPITNHQDASYGDISVYTRVSTSIDWIDSVIN